MQHREDTQTRLLRHVEKNNETGCWEWTGSKYRCGYGQTWSGEYTDKGHTKCEGAHRVMWKCVNGDPGDLFVLHKCDNRGCVNPDHLFLGTHIDNMKDRNTKGRAKGPSKDLVRSKSRKDYDKVTEIDVSAIRKSTESCTLLASKYGISISQVSRIKRYKRWRYV
jgi:hypothetical protein